jgi:transcriptional regulator with XRE-family HTH domain
MKSLGQRVRELRDAKDLSLRELSAASKVSRASLSEIELDRRSPSDAILRAIAKPLGTTFEDLKEHDTKPTLDEIRRRVLIDPRLGFAFRRLLDENVSAEDLVNLADSKAKRTKKK